MAPQWHGACSNGGSEPALEATRKVRQKALEFVRWAVETHGVVRSDVGRVVASVSQGSRPAPRSPPEAVEQ